MGERIDGKNRAWVNAYGWGMEVVRGPAGVNGMSRIKRGGGLIFMLDCGDGADWPSFSLWHM